MTTIALAARGRLTEPYVIAAWLDRGRDYHDDSTLTTEEEELLTDHWPA